VSALEIRAASDCRYDLVALGEVMLRFDPGERRVRNAREFSVWEGGGEYNVARGLRRCFGLRTAIVTAFADNEIGRLLEDLVLQGGVDTALISWVPYDGVGRATRNGLNFTERGFGVRGALGVSDRGHTAASIVSYDLNYRPSLWKAIGGVARAREVNRRLAHHVDVMIGNEEDFTACLGLEVEGTDAGLSELASSSFRAMIERASAEFPNLRVIATTLRAVRTATVNDWGAIAWSREDGFVQAAQRDGLEILDRVGGGDSFASGLLYGLLQLGDLALAVEYGAAHGALAMTTPGDTSSATLAEVEALVRGGGARVQR